VIIQARNLDAVSDERIAAIKKLNKKGEKPLRHAKALEQKVIRMKLAGPGEKPGPLTADMCTRNAAGSWCHGCTCGSDGRGRSRHPRSQQAES
jgi:hypothetical protein